MSKELYIEGIGRRKTASARVRLTPAKETSILVNEKSLTDYFQNEAFEKDVMSVLETEEAGVGDYTITVKVSNSEKDVTRGREITVPSHNAPQVNIISPKSGEFFVQESNVLIDATAISENGISRADFYVKDSLVSSLSGSSNNNYKFSWIVREDAGPVELKVSAVAKQTGLTGCDSVLVNVEGIIPGKYDAGK